MSGVLERCPLFQGVPLEAVVAAQRCADRVVRSRGELHLTGTTLFTTSRVLSRWEAEGIVRAGRQRLVIRNPHALVEVAEDLTLPDRKDHRDPGR